MSRLLINCRDLNYRAWEQDRYQSESVIWDLRQLNWNVEAGERVSFIYEDEEQKQVFWRLLLNKLKPKSGLLEIQSGVLVYSDQMLWTRARGNAGLEENLKSKLFETQPWLNQRRVPLIQLYDRVGLSGRALKTPLADLPPHDQLKAWLIMLMAARVKVWLVERLFQQTQGENLKLIMEWLAGFQGAWIFFERDGQTKEEKFNSVMTSFVHLHRNGTFTEQTVNAGSGG